jgi:hypothetical protein
MIESVSNWQRVQLTVSFQQETKKPSRKIGIWTLDWMALDQTTRSKVFVNFGNRSNVIFGGRSKFLLIYAIFWQ